MGRILKILIILIGVAAVLLLVRRALARRRQPPQPPQTTHQMLKCAHCGVHIPQAAAILDGSQAYCSEEHRRIGAKNS